jgi:Outer membrane lipoprotein carrier protein LolA-like
MISGIALTTALLLTANPPSDLSPETATLIASLARPAPASTPYTEVHFAKLLREPLTLHGQLDYSGGDKLGKRVDSPYKETTTIADGKATIEREGRGAKTFGLDRAPDLQGLLASFSALLSGDSATMNRYYAIDETVDEKHWTLTLRPRSDALAKHLKTVIIDGAGKEPRCFTMVQADEDASVMLLGDLAKTTLPTPLTRESLDSLCRRPAQ